MGKESRATRPQNNDKTPTNKNKKHILTMTPPHPTLGTHARSPRPTRLRPRLRLRLRPRPLLPSPMTTTVLPPPSPSPPPPLLLLLLLLLSLLPHLSSSFACHSPFATVDGVVVDAPSSLLTSTSTHRRIVLRASTLGGVRMSTLSYSRFGGNYDDDGDDDEYGIAVPF